MENEYKFIALNEEGEEFECEILFTFESGETGKNYLVYTDHTLDEDGDVKVYASIFDPQEKNQKLIPIETEREWEIVSNILETLQNEVADIDE